MSRRLIRVTAVAVAVVLAGLALAALSRDEAPATVTDTRHGNVTFAKGELDRILHAANETSSSTAPDELVAEGRRIFRDESLYEEGESCQTCHTEGSAADKLGTIVHDRDATGRSPGAPTDFDGPRDPPALWGLARTPPFFWNGDVQTLRAALIRPVKGHFKEFVPGGGTVPDVDCTTTSQECEDRAGRFAAALEAYVKTLDPPTSAFDQGTLSEAALRGEKVFQGKAACIECHGGPLFTDNAIHNTGVPLGPSFVSPFSGRTLQPNDPGAGPLPLPAECRVANPPAGCEGPPPPFDKTAFINTPQLRDVRNTAPYMHNGAFRTLREVVEFYNSSSAVAPLNLTPEEIDDLVAYLEAL